MRGIGDPRAVTRSWREPARVLRRRPGRHRRHRPRPGSCGCWDRPAPNAFSDKRAASAANACGGVQRLPTGPQA
eukprot:9971508-Alexandrium_andersonii.AAC.1